MCPRHGRHVYWFAVFVLLRPTIPLIVSETVLDTNDDPNIDNVSLSSDNVIQLWVVIFNSGWAEKFTIGL